MKRIWLDWLNATLFVFAVMWGIYQITKIDVFNAFDPLGKAIGDIEITDVTFSYFRLEVPPVDTNIVIVNIGNLSRAEIAMQVRTIAQFKPRVIGVDSYFICPEGKTDSISCPNAYDTLSNLMLGSAFADAGNVVLVTKLLQTKALVEQYGDIDKYDSIQYTDSIIRGNCYGGFANLDTDADHQEDLKACRRFNPRVVTEQSEEHLAFSVQVAMLFDSVKTKRFLARNKESEVINYRGNVPDVYGASAPEFGNRYFYLDWYQVFDTASYLPNVLIRDKIVLFGFMGANMEDTSWDDKFITPLNKQFAGRTRPDMYGVVVHANALSMILNEDYIDELAEWQEFVIAFVICFLNVALFWKIYHKLPLWFDGMVVVIQMLQLVLFTFLTIFVLYWFNFKLNLTITLVAIALVGTCFELYVSLVKVLVIRMRANKWFTKKKEEVLTPTKR